MDLPFSPIHGFVLIDHFLCNVVSPLFKKHLSINLPSFYIFVVLLQAFKTSFPLLGHPKEPPCVGHPPEPPRVSQTPQNSASSLFSVYSNSWMPWSCWSNCHPVRGRVPLEVRFEAWRPQAQACGLRCRTLSHFSSTISAFMLSCFHSMASELAPLSFQLQAVDHNAITMETWELLEDRSA